MLFEPCTLNRPVLELFFKGFGFDLGTAGMDSRPY